MTRETQILKKKMDANRIGDRKEQIRAGNYSGFLNKLSNAARASLGERGGCWTGLGW